MHNTYYTCLAVTSSCFVGLLLVGFVSRVHLATIQPQLPESTISDSFTISVIVNSTNPEGTKPGSDATYDIVINDTETTGFIRTTEAAETRTEDTPAFPTRVPDVTSQESIHIKDTTAAFNGISDRSTTSVEVDNTPFTEVYNQSVDLTISRDTTTSYVDVQFSEETAVGRLPTTAEMNHQSVDLTISRDTTTSYVDVQYSKETVVGRLPTTAQSETETTNGSTLLQTTTTAAPLTYSTGKSDDKVTKV